jgi:hypothetical protein
MSRERAPQHWHQIGVLDAKQLGHRSQQCCWRLVLHFIDQRQQLRKFTSTQPLFRQFYQTTYVDDCQSTEQT